MEIVRVVVKSNLGRKLLTKEIDESFSLGKIRTKKKKKEKLNKHINKFRII